MASASASPSMYSFSQTERYSSRCFAQSPLKTRADDGLENQVSMASLDDNVVYLLPKSSNSEIHTPSTASSFSSISSTSSKSSRRRSPPTITIPIKQKLAVHLTRSYTVQTAEGSRQVSSFSEGLESSDDLIQDISYEWRYSN